jgi:hypothetical protein
MKYRFDNSYESIYELAQDGEYYVYLASYASVGITWKNRESTKLHKLAAWLESYEEIGR